VWQAVDNCRGAYAHNNGEEGRVHQMIYIQNGYSMYGFLLFLATLRNLKLNLSTSTGKVSRAFSLLPHDCMTGRQSGWLMYHFLT